ncbi:MAG: hydroxymethylglutaryl-CoA lyase [Candidatus Obscuribacter sp.]|nr:hydroxymethylglutaryl-CoA lyase [Candidatus Obscuribacter sp.]MBK9278193.1 hydroxymethylglutaryl-CoA lyase [Candidatus Obscuribacter sp.]
MPGEITVFEVGPRDGLQNEAGQVETADKVALIEALAQSGLKHIEITSFVSPKWIPQLADGLAVARQLQLPSDVQTSALVPNLKGYEGACAAGLKQINLFLSASESHSKKNINKSVAEALSTMKEVAAAALADGKRIRCYVSTVFACPYEGPVKPEQVVMVVEGLLQMGVHEISLGDTIGAANPRQVKEVLDRLSGVVPLPRLALHFHDTRGTALANVVAGIESGVTIFDSSLGGLGGCPYAPGASGNLATEDLVYMLEGMGIKTGVNLERLVDAGALAEKILGKKLPGRYLQAALATRAKACAG